MPYKFPMKPKQRETSLLSSIIIAAAITAAAGIAWAAYFADSPQTAHVQKNIETQ